MKTNELLGWQLICFNNIYLFILNLCTFGLEVHKFKIYFIAGLVAGKIL